MKKRILILVLALPVFLFAEDAPLETLQYRVYIWTAFKNPNHEPSKAIDPFSEEARESVRASAPPTDTLEGRISHALDIQITEENRKFIIFDGENIYARISKAEHKKLQAAMETEGGAVTRKKEFQLQELAYHKKQKGSGFGKSRTKNRRNSALDYYLSKKEIELPSDDYLMIAYQPNGNVSSCMIIDLEARSVRILPGTHDKKDEEFIELSSSEYDYLSELNSSELMKNFPSTSGKLGLDGYSLVIYSRSAETERFISHWQPEYMGLDIFRAIHKHFEGKSKGPKNPIF